MSVVAVINAGSSSIKLAAFEDVTSPRLILRGHIDGIGVNTRMRLLDGSGATLSDEPLDAALEHEDATELLAKRVADCLAGRAIVAVGHRVVHGGPRHSSPGSSRQSCWKNWKPSSRSRRCTNRIISRPSVRCALRAPACRK